MATCFLSLDGEKKKKKKKERTKFEKGRAASFFSLAHCSASSSWVFWLHGRVTVGLQAEEQGGVGEREKLL